MNSSFDSIIKAKTGFGLDDIFDGYKFKRKNGENFVFHNDMHEIQFTIQALRSALLDKIEEKNLSDLLKRLNKKGIFKQKFDLLNFRTQSLNEYRVHQIEENSPYITMKDVDGNFRNVHFTLLQDEQTKHLIENLKTIEHDFDNLDLTFILKSIKRICEQVFHPANESNRAPDINPTLLRLKILILDRLENSEFDLTELSPCELKELQDEINFSKKLVDPANKPLLRGFNKANFKVQKQIQISETINMLNTLNHDDFLEIFDIEKLKTKLIFDISILENNQDIFDFNYNRIHETIELKTNISFKKPSEKIESAENFIENLNNLQRKYINTQLRVGSKDLELILRFNLDTNFENSSYSILQEHIEITDRERFELHKELVEHRLLLLFKMGITDEYFKELARINVNDFYRFIYGIK